MASATPAQMAVAFFTQMDVHAQRIGIDSQTYATATAETMCLLCDLKNLEMLDNFYIAKIPGATQNQLNAIASKRQQIKGRIDAIITQLDDVARLG